MSMLRPIVAGCAIAALLVGCGVAPRAVMVERNPGVASRPQGSVPVAGRMHTVQRGDTLYGIAFRHGLDYRQVAAWNVIAAPYTIYPGQQLRLSPRDAQPAATRGTATSPPRPTPAPTPGAAPARPPVVATPAPASPVTPVTPQPVSPAPVSTPAPVAAPPRPVTAPAMPSGPVRWQWPTAGQVVSRFVAGDPTRQGISIVGSAGQAVNAASDGVVVYSGSGLIGYGELIIVKHSDEFLSAYGHNRKRLVAEGDQVRSGQQIAEMGRSGAARDMLHFEIRRNGKPVDPSAHLPSR